jgi:hypothetical protein
MADPHGIALDRKNRLIGVLMYHLPEMFEDSLRTQTSR